MYVVSLNTATLEKVQNYLDLNTKLFIIYISLTMRKRLMPAKSSFLVEGNGVKDFFFSPVNCLVTSVVPPIENYRNPVIKPSIFY